MPHWIAMSGERGCLPDHCEVFRTKKDAVDDLTFLFDLSERRRRELSRTESLDLRPDDGAEYCEVMPCDCDDPAIHSDSETWGE